MEMMESNVSYAKLRLNRERFDVIVCEAWTLVHNDPVWHQTGPRCWISRKSKVGSQRPKRVSSIAMVLQQEAGLMVEA